jgi:ABC-type transport system involved in multi-copper enzyme maturation permease subunit
MLREYRFAWWGMLAWFIVLEALLVGAILFWPSFEENIDALRDMAPMDSLKGMIDQLEVGGVIAYVNGQHFFKGCNTVGTLAAVVFAMNVVAGEAQRGTLEILLARPMSRRRVLTERWIAGALATIVPVFVSTHSIPWLMSYIDEDMAHWPLFLSAVHQSLLLLMLYALTFALSCAGSRPLVIGFGMLLFMLAEFSIYLVQTLTHWSLFRLTDIDAFAYIGATHSLEWTKVLPMTLAVVVLFELSQRLYARR